MPRHQDAVSRPRWRPSDREPTLAEIEEATLFSAYLVEQYGEQYAPIMDRLVIELEEARKRGGSPTERAKRILHEAEADGRLAAVNITRKR
ncbi:hypothetical protein WYO_5454 [Methylobacterium sp. GXF4]|nr:hypothetical protein WYO_5454 [Methylobacterium sp. GXF4]